jgi:hypothetical protein
MDIPNEVRSGPTAIKPFLYPICPRISEQFNSAKSKRADTSDTIEIRCASLQVEVKRIPSHPTKQFLPKFREREKDDCEAKEHLLQCLRLKSKLVRFKKKKKERKKNQTVDSRLNPESNGCPCLYYRSHPSATRCRCDPAAIEPMLYRFCP